MPTYSEPIPRLAFAPGLEATQSSGAKPPVYAPISFAAKYETEIWTTVRNQKKRRNNKKYQQQRDL